MSYPLRPSPANGVRIFWYVAIKIQNKHTGIFKQWHRAPMISMQLRIELPNDLDWFPFMRDDFDVKIKQNLHTYYVLPHVLIRRGDETFSGRLVVSNVETFYLMEKPKRIQSLTAARNAVNDANTMVHQVYEKKSPDKTLMNSMYLSNVSLYKPCPEGNTEHILFSVQRRLDIFEAQRGLARALLLPIDTKAKLLAGQSAGWITNEMMARTVQEKVRLENEMEAKNLLTNSARQDAWWDLELAFKQIDRKMWQDIPRLHSFLTDVPAHPRMVLNFEETDFMYKKSSGDVVEYCVHFQKLKSKVEEQLPPVYLFQQAKELPEKDKPNTQRSEI